MVFRKDALQSQESEIGREETGGQRPVSARTSASQREWNGKNGEKAMSSAGLRDWKAGLSHSLP